MGKQAPDRLELGNGLVLVVRKDHYAGLWEIRYEGSGGRWAGPWRTRREARERLEEARERLEDSNG